MLYMYVYIYIYIYIGGVTDTSIVDSRRSIESQVTVQESVDAGNDWHVTSSRGAAALPVVSYRVRCDPGYYGPRCALACNPRQDKFGHYKCNDNGTRSCLDGWTGKFCDIREWRHCFVHTGNVLPIRCSIVFNSKFAKTIMQSPKNSWGKPVKSKLSDLNLNLLLSAISQMSISIKKKEHKYTK